MPTSTSIIQKKTPQPDPRPPQRQDEEGPWGKMPSPDSDDSVDAIAEEMTLEDQGDEVEELNIADKVNQAERSRHFSE